MAHLTRPSELKLKDKEMTNYQSGLVIDLNLPSAVGSNNQSGREEAARFARNDTLETLKWRPRAGTRMVTLNVTELSSLRAARQALLFGLLLQ